MVHADIEQRQKGITMYFTFLYNTFQNHDLMRPWKANWRPWDKAGTFVYTRFGLTFRSVSVLAPIFRKYPLSRWWICPVSDPSPKLHSVPVWMDELNPGLRSFHQDPAQLHLHFVLLHMALCAVPARALTLCVMWRAASCIRFCCDTGWVLTDEAWRKSWGVRSQSDRKDQVVLKLLVI